MKFLILTMKVAVLAAFVQFKAILAQSLPSYIHVCARHDPNLNECVKQSAIFALPYVLKGDSSIKLEPLLPYSLPHVEIKTAGDLTFKFTDSTLFGLDTMQILSADLDLENGRIKFHGKLGYGILVGNYNIDGRILILPVTGSGFANVTIENVDAEYSLEFELVERDGKEYISSKKSHIELAPEVSRYRFDNLFNGDPVLGPEMNKFLNENHQEVTRDLGPFFGAVFSTIVTHILNAFIEKVPMDVLFP